MAKRPLEIAVPKCRVYFGGIIYTVKPSVDANAEATRAKAQAQQDMRAPHG